MVLPTGQTPLSLLFWNRQSIEARSGGCYDGAILEISTNAGGTWTQVSNADLLVGQYQGRSVLHSAIRWLASTRGAVIRRLGSVMSSVLTPMLDRP